MNDRPKARDLAAGKWGTVLPLLGIDAHFLNGRHHRCPSTGEGTDRFRFADRNGTGSFHCHCSDGSKGGIALVMCCKGIDYAEACREVERVAGGASYDRPRPDPQRAATNRMQRIKSHLAAIGAGDDVTMYLASRGLDVPPMGLGKATRLDYYETGSRDPLGRYTAMVGKVMTPAGSTSALHITYLEKGKKAPVSSPRKIYGSLPSGCAVRLFAPAEEMGVGEGIETSLSCRVLFDVPTWAAINEGNLRHFEPPAETKLLHIFADKDDNYAGQAAAYDLAHRLKRRGVDCEVHLPTLPGKCDWNDVLQNKRATQ